MKTTTRKRSRPATRQPDMVVDQRVVKAIGHPLRHRLLLAYNQKTASPNELANELGEPLGNVAYHTRILLDLEAVELVDTAQRRGATEHYYRATMLPFFNDAEWARLPITTRRSILAQDLQKLFADVGDAVAGGGFDKPEAHLSFIKLDVDREGYDEIVKLLADVVDRVLAIQAETAGRRIDDDADEEEVVSTEVAMLFFEQGDPPPAATPRRKAKRR
jgi:DNA-binding transcriptional ArsR family regulator